MDLRRQDATTVSIRLARDQEHECRPFRVPAFVHDVSATAPRPGGYAAKTSRTVRVISGHLDFMGVIFLEDSPPN